eukprot:scaffold16605_cov174-Isochrysis_galbana.AAC.1
MQRALWGPSSRPADPRQWLQHFGESVQVAAGKAFKCLRCCQAVSVCGSGRVTDTPPPLPAGGC